MIRLTWPNVIEAVERLVKEFGSQRVWGVPRGGAIVAHLLSYRGCFVTVKPEPGVIIVDDIADSGKILAGYGKQGFPTAALWMRETCEPKPNFYAAIVTREDDYILFPWELETEAKETNETAH